jgi:branched-chain amino acid transport system substrate-binding protein
VEQARKLVEEEEVLFVFNTLGTPPNSAIHKYMNGKKVPQLFVATGATKWGDPKNFPWTMGWQPNYQSEGQGLRRAPAGDQAQRQDRHPVPERRLRQRLPEGLRGRPGRQGRVDDRLQDQLRGDRPHHRQPDGVAEGTGADTFFNITTPKFAAQAIKKAAEIGWKPTHYLNSVSASVGSVMIPAGAENGVGVFTASYLKDPTDPQFQTGKDWDDYLAFMKKYMASAEIKDVNHTYGYTVAQGLVQVLKQAGDNLTRENIMKQAASLDITLPMLLPGVNVKTGPDDFFPIEREQLARSSTARPGCCSARSTAGN